MESSPETDGSLQNFLEVLREMDRRGERRRFFKGDIDGPFFSNAEYKMVVRIGIVPDGHFKGGRKSGIRRLERDDMDFMEKVR